MKRYLPFVIIAGVFVVAIVGYVTLVRSRRVDSSTPFAAGVSATPGSQAVAAPAVSPSPGSPVLSQSGPSPQEAPAVAQPSNLPPGASVTIEEFGDYQCPPCGLLHPDL